MKRLLLLAMVLILVACTPPDYPRKDDEDPNYYDTYLTDLGVTSYEKLDQFFDQDALDLGYDMFGIEQETESFFIYHYLGETTDGLVHVIIPDRVGEENLVLPDFLPERETLEAIIVEFNLGFDSTEMIWTNNDTAPFDIDLDDTTRFEFASRLYRGRTINDVVIDVDEETIRTLILDNLSSPLMYRIGSYQIPDSGYTRYVYLGQGINHDLVFVLDNYQRAKVTVIGYYDFNTSE